jgi:transcriptional regulator with XRE-family HTH domain
MNAAELRSILSALGLSQVDLARLILISTRAVNLWATGERVVPGPVAAYLRLILSLPPALRVKEVSRLGGQTMSIDGMYAVEFAGKTGSGVASLVLDKGIVFGSDGEVQYDGTYQPSAEPGEIDLSVTARVPPNAQLVMAYPPQPVPYSFSLTCSFKPQSSSEVRIQTDLGPVSARIHYMRRLPS